MATDLVPRNGTNDIQSLIPAGNERLQTQLQVLNNIDRNKYNVLAPVSVHALSPYHTIGVEIVQLSANDSDGDVYKQGWGANAALAITKVALNKLADAAGLVWDISECKRLDNRSNPDYVTFQACGRIRRPDGSWLRKRAEKEIDLRVIEAELQQQYEGKADNQYENGKKVAPLAGEKREKFIRDGVLKELTQKRKHKVGLCETGAMLRVVRSLLNVRSSYSAVDIVKPWVIARIDVDLGSDPELRRAARVLAMQDIAELYGEADQPQAQLEAAKTVMQRVHPGIRDDDEPADDAVVDIEGDEDVETRHIDESTGEIIDDSTDLPDDPTAELRALCEVEMRRIGKPSIDKYCQRKFAGRTFAELGHDALLVTLEDLRLTARPWQAVGTKGEG